MISRVMLQDGRQRKKSRTRDSPELPDSKMEASSFTSASFFFFFWS